MRRNLPLVYFLGVEPGKYLAEWPVFIKEDLPKDLTFLVDVDEKSLIEDYRKGKPGEELYVYEDDADYRRRYATNQAITRLHQRVFRARVLTAYREQCAFCRLRHLQLLDAAHIIPDNDVAWTAIYNKLIRINCVIEARFLRHPPF